MELRQLEYYAELCKTRNFTKASENLNVAQPSVTKAVQKLEEELGTELVIRTQKPLGLTKAGERFYERTTEILELLDTAVAEASGLPVGSMKTLSVGVSPISGVELTHMLLDVDVSKTGLVLNIIERSSVEIISRILNKELDIGWVIGGHLPPELAFVPIEIQEAKCLLPPNSPLLGRETLRFEDLKNEPFAMALTSSKSLVGEIISKRCHEAGFEPKCAVSLQGFHPNSRMYIKWIRSGVGLGFIPEHAVRDITDLAMPAIEPPVTLEVGLAYRRTTRLPAETKRFIEYIRENYPKHLQEKGIEYKRR